MLNIEVLDHIWQGHHIQSSSNSERLKPGSKNSKYLKLAEKAISEAGKSLRIGEIIEYCLSDLADKEGNLSTEYKNQRRILCKKIHCLGDHDYLQKVKTDNGYYFKLLEWD